MGIFLAVCSLIFFTYPDSYWTFIHDDDDNDGDNGNDDNDDNDDDDDDDNDIDSKNDNDNGDNNDESYFKTCMYECMYA